MSVSEETSAAGVTSDGPARGFDEPEPGTDRRGWGRTVLRRWPTLLALAGAAAAWGMEMASAAVLLTLLPMIYMILTLVARRAASWLVLLVAGVVLVLAELQPWVEPVVVLLVITAVVGAAALARTGNRIEPIIQLAGAVVFAAISIAAPSAGVQAATVLVAVGFIGHGVWDLVHLRRRAVVSATYAECCAVFDLALGAQLLILA